MKKLGSVKIEVDASKCRNPMECKKCMQVCPEAVFAAIPTKVKKYALSKEFFLFAPFQAACVLCNLCTSVCPKGAIRLVPQEEKKGQ
ncbi:MAG: 4Fe-4S dicluster-binding protein [Promethearchaeati archaeon SRVP18_Atabeyarchaeia-1]